MSISSASFPEMYLTSVNPLKFLEEKAALVKENEEMKKQLEENANQKKESYVALRDLVQVERVMRHMNDIEDMRTPFMHHCLTFLRRYDELSEQGKEMLNKECGQPWVECIEERAHETVMQSCNHDLRGEMMEAKYKRKFCKGRKENEQVDKTS